MAKKKAAKKAPAKKVAQKAAPVRAAKKPVKKTPAKVPLSGRVRVHVKQIAPCHVVDVHSQAADWLEQTVAKAGFRVVNKGKAVEGVPLIRLHVYPKDKAKTDEVREFLENNESIDVVD